MIKKYLIVVGGPTASGKTEVAIKLAQHFNTDIISADSRQFYKETNIGTAKPTKEELSLAKHHFIDSLNITDNYSVGDFERDAIALLSALFHSKNVVVMAGGSGLFIKAVCEGLDEFPEVSSSITDQLKTELLENGIASLKDELKKSDPDYYKEVDLENPHRLIRAISVTRASGAPFSSFRKNKKVTRIFEPIYLQLEWDRKLLYERINQRVDNMVESGLVDEARQLVQGQHLNSLQTVGYQELFDHFNGKCTLGEAIDLIKRNSRRYAKRQLTWFRKNDYWQRFSAQDLDGIFNYLQERMSESSID